MASPNRRSGFEQADATSEDGPFEAAPSSISASAESDERSQKSLPPVILPTTIGEAVTYAHSDGAKRLLTLAAELAGRDTGSRIGARDLFAAALVLGSLMP